MQPGWINNIGFVLGGLGIGSLLTTLIAGYLTYRQDKKKIIFQEKLICYSKVAEAVFSYQPDQEVYDAHKMIAPALLLIEDDEIRAKINDFFTQAHWNYIALNQHKASEVIPEINQALKKASTEKREIIQILSDDLNNAL